MSLYGDGKNSHHRGAETQRIAAKQESGVREMQKRKAKALDSGIRSE